MTKSSFRLPSQFRFLFAGLVAGAASLALSSSAFGRGGGVVEYDPVLKSLEGLIPFSASYTLTVTAPTDLPPGSYTVTPAPRVNSAPAGVDSSTALGYLKFSGPQLTFTSAGQSQSLTVTLDVPAGAVTGSYAYQIYTSGWPNTPTDFGAAVNATVTLAPNTEPPSVTISTPEQNAVFALPSGTVFPVQLPFGFTAVSTQSAITSIAAELTGVSGSSLTISQTTGLNTTNVSASGTMTIPAVGAYSVQARATNGNGTAEDIHAFTVSVSATAPPTVTIQSPVSGSIFDAPWTVSFNFKATSTSSIITNLQATLDGAPLTIVRNGLNTTEAVGTTTLPFQFGGQHVLIVTGVDAAGASATATSNFTIRGEPPPTQMNAKLRGVVFLDIDGDGVRDTDETGVLGITVNIQPSSVNNVSSRQTVGGGEFAFDVAPNTSYRIDVLVPAGLTPTTTQSWTGSASSGDVKSVGEFGVKLDFGALRSMKADGLSHGYWKENVAKTRDWTVDGRTNGLQEKPEDVIRFTNDIWLFALSRFNNLSLDSAIETFTSRDPLLVQLLAAEYNFVSGRLVGGSVPVTYAFIAWGEYVDAHESAAARDEAKDWFDAFNNSHGGFLFSGRKK